MTEQTENTDSIALIIIAETLAIESEEISPTDEFGEELQATMEDLTEIKARIEDQFEIELPFEVEDNFPETVGELLEIIHDTWL